MFEKFGEFDTYEEINKAAEGQKAEGDDTALKELAAENGIDMEDAEDYYDGTIEALCDPLSAALGKLMVETEDLKPKDIMEDWRNYIVMLCDYSNPDKSEKERSQAMKMCIAVRKTGKSLKGCIAELLKWSFNHQNPVDKEVLKAAGVNASKVTLGIPGMATAHKIIRDYYVGGDK